MISRLNYEDLGVPISLQLVNLEVGYDLTFGSNIASDLTRHFSKYKAIPAKSGGMKKDLRDSTDEELLLRLAEGEREALDHLYSRHSGRILNYGLRRGLSQERSEDVLQIVFLQLHRKKHLYNPRHSALAWIYVITRSELKDYRNREIKDFSELDESLSQTADSAPKLEMKDEAESLLEELKPREQEVMRLRYLDEMEYDEIAILLKESESNLRQIVSRSLRFLRSRGKNS